MPNAQELSDEFDKLAETKEIPVYKQPTKNGKASVPGTQSVHYNTGDTNLDGIIHDSIIAHKGTAGTAEMRGEALDKIGVDSSCVLRYAIYQLKMLINKLVVLVIMVLSRYVKYYVVKPTLHHPLRQLKTQYRPNQWTNTTSCT